MGILFKHTIELFQRDAMTAFNNVNWAVWSKTYVIELDDKKRTLTAPWHGRLLPYIELVELQQDA